MACGWGGWHARSPPPVSVAGRPPGVAPAVAGAWRPARPAGVVPPPPPPRAVSPRAACAHDVGGARPVAVAFHSLFFLSPLLPSPSLTPPACVCPALDAAGSGQVKHGQWPAAVAAVPPDRLPLWPPARGRPPRGRVTPYATAPPPFPPTLPTACAPHLSPPSRRGCSLARPDGRGGAPRCLWGSPAPNSTPRPPLPSGGIGGSKVGCSPPTYIPRSPVGWRSAVAPLPSLPWIASAWPWTCRGEASDDQPPGGSNSTEPL